MNAEIISVGTELLLGEIVNTDARFVSEALSELGINVFYHTVVGDNPTRLAAIMNTAKKRSQLIITTGGLGPTYDDLTKEVICETFGLSLELSEESLSRIQIFFDRLGRPMTNNNIKQAMLPKGCYVLSNDYGTAPGCVVETEGTMVAMLPGPPRECEPMMRDKLMPYLASKRDGFILSRRVRIFGMGESAVEEKLQGMMESAINPSIAPYAKEGEVMLRITAKAETEERAREMLSPICEKVVSELGNVVYGVDVESLEEAIILKYAEKGLTIACAESCTGGLVSKRLTDIPGSSYVLMGGAVTYSNESKTKLLSVPEDILHSHGAVSARCAEYMAMGAAKLFGTDVAVSTTGIAGPDGGTDEKPVGLVYVGIYRNGETTSHKLMLGGRNRDRAYIRHMAASHALKLALDCCED